MTQAAEKVQRSTIFNYANALLMASFGGTKEAVVKFIISRYHNGRFYFDQLIDITGEVISKLTGLSNKGSHVPIGIKEGLVQELTGTSTGKKLKGLMIGQIATRTPQIVAKIIAVTLTLAGRSSDLKLEMLEAVDMIATDGQVYQWGDYVADLVKTIYDRCQEVGGILKFPSLIIWIVMYHICPEGSRVFREPTRFETHRFKPFSQKGTLHELAQGKIFLDTWLQQLKVRTMRWRVP